MRVSPTGLPADGTFVSEPPVPQVPRASAAPDAISQRLWMRVGEHLTGVMTRLALFTFRLSLALFEFDVVRRLFRRRSGPKVVSGPAQLAHSSVDAVAAADAQGRRAIPIVFIHQANSEHLKYSLAQAKKSNPDSTVFLLGDDSNNRYSCV